MRDGHLARGYFFRRGADEAELTVAQGFGVVIAAVSSIHAYRRAEDAAGHGTPLVDAAKAGCGVERRAGCIVGEVFEAFLLFIACAERAGFRVARKICSICREPRAGAAFDGLCG